MNRRPLPPQTYLNECLRYEPDTGKLFWRERPVSHFRDGKQTAQHNCNAWNGAYADREAFTATSLNGYATGCLDRIIYRAHRIIWKMVRGYDPQDIDHINGDRRDNRLINLRAVSRRENMRNSRLRSNNKSGVVGVSRAKSGKWTAQIKGGSQQWLGRFDTFEEAVEARRDAEREIGFHPNHGRSVATVTSIDEAYAFLRECGAPGVAA